MRMSGDEVEPPELLALCDGRNWLFRVSNSRHIEDPAELTTAILYGIGQCNAFDWIIMLMRCTEAPER
jgi:hypothetical protein